MYDGFFFKDCENIYPSKIQVVLKLQLDQGGQLSIYAETSI